MNPEWPEADVEIARLRGLKGRSLTDQSVLRTHQESGARLYTLAEQRPDAALQLLEREYAALRAGEGDISVSGALVGGLVKARHRQAVPLISRMLLDPSARGLREDLAEDLGALGDPTAGPALVNALSDEESWVKAKAARSLGLLGYKPAIEWLLQLLHDESGDVRASAANALGRLKAREAITILAEIVKNDDDEVVRGAAGNAIQQLRESGNG